jgi:hypothetical protein
MLPIINSNVNRRSDRNPYEQFLYEQHIQRVKNILPVLKTHILANEDKKESISTNFITNKWKKDNDYKIKKLEEENKVILENIRNSNKLTTIDNKLDIHILTVRKFKKDLYLRGKKLRFRKIVEENRKLLQRIVNVEPIYRFNN